VLLPDTRANLLRAEHYGSAYECRRRSVLKPQTDPGSKAVVRGVVYPENRVIIDKYRAIAGQLQPEPDPKVKQFLEVGVPGKMKLERTEVGSLLYATATVVLPGLYWCAQWNRANG
jgi:hypothetical protein